MAVLTLVATSCGIPNQGTVDTDPWSSFNECTTIFVDNMNYADVVVKHVTTGRRVGTVVGKTSDTFEMCGIDGYPSRFNLDAIGSRVEMNLEGERHILMNDAIEIQISPSPSMRGSFFTIYQRRMAGFGGAEDFYIFGVTPIQPFAMHLGVWHDVASCLRLDPIPDPTQIQWFVADALVDTESMSMVYGATEFDEDDQPVSVFLDRKYIFHAGVVSHEIVHVFTGPEESNQCVMFVPGDLPLRDVPERYLDQIGE